jgi:hypothetical protein
MDAKDADTCTRSGRESKLPKHLQGYVLEKVMFKKDRGAPRARSALLVRSAVKAPKSTAQGLSSTLPIGLLRMPSNLDTGVSRTNSSKSQGPFAQDLLAVLCESTVASRVSSAQNSIPARSGSTNVEDLPTFQKELSRLPSDWLCNPVSRASSMVFI